MPKSEQSAPDKARPTEDALLAETHRAAFSSVLRELNVPDEAVERLAGEGIASFVDIRRRGGNLQP